MPSAFLATDLYDVLRGTTTNEYGDEGDLDVPVGLPLQGCVTDASRRDWDRATGTPRTVRWYTGRFRPGSDIQAGDRLRSRTTGTVYQLDSDAELPPVAGNVDVIVDLMRVTKAG